MISAILFRIRYWLKVLKYIRPVSIGAALGLFVSLLFDIPLFIFFKENPAILRGGIIYVKKYDAYFYVRSFTDDLYYVTPGREGIIEKFLVSTLKGEDIFVDVGANIGYYTILAAKKVKKQGKVIAIEPIPENVGVLMTNIKLNNLNNVRVMPKAAWNTSNIKIAMYIPSIKERIKFFGTSSSGKRGYNLVLVETVTLDSVLDSTKKIKVIKIDVEGAEKQVLEGALNALDKTHMVYVECRKENLGYLLGILIKKSFSCSLVHAPHAAHLLCYRKMQHKCD